MTRVRPARSGRGFSSGRVPSSTMASGCPLSWTNLRDQERVRVVASRTGWQWQPQPPASHLLRVEPVLAVGLQQVLVDDLIPQRPRQLDFLPGAM